MPTLPFRRTVTELAVDETIFSAPSSRTSQVGIEDSIYFRNEAAEANKAVQEMEQQLADSDARAHAARTKMVAAINEMRSVANSLSNTPIVPSTPVASTSKLPDVLTSSSPIVDVADDGSEKAWIAQADSRSQSPTQQVESSPSHD
jgi:2',3'-cyclic-nucleotide 2'-phosphodiesterase (5'-nucleotidase family)